MVWRNFFSYINHYYFLQLLLVKNVTEPTPPPCQGTKYLSNKAITWHMLIHFSYVMTQQKAKIINNFHLGIRGFILSLKLCRCDFYNNYQQQTIQVIVPIWRVCCTQFYMHGVTLSRSSIICMANSMVCLWHDVNEPSNKNIGNMQQEK